MQNSRIMENDNTTNTRVGLVVSNAATGAGNLPCMVLSGEVQKLQIPGN